MKKPTAQGMLLIRDPAQVRALASPARQEIIDALAAAGACSAAELAGHLGRPPDALYFHLKRLLAVGLIVEREPRRNGRHIATVYDVPGRPVRIQYGGAVGGPALQQVVGSALRLAGRDFGRAFAPGGGAITDGPGRNLWGGRVKGWVGRRELVEINRLIKRLSDVIGSGRPGRRRRPQTFTYVLAPVRPSRRAGQGASR